MLGTVSGSVLQLVAPYASRRPISGPDLAYATHRLIHATAVSTDLVGMFVDLRSTGINKVVTTGTSVAAERSNCRDHLCRRAPHTVSMSSIISSDAPRRSCVRTGQRASAVPERDLPVSSSSDWCLSLTAHPGAPPRCTVSSRLRFPSDSLSTQHLDVDTEPVVLHSFLPLNVYSTVSSSRLNCWGHVYFSSQVPGLLLNKS